MKPNNDVEGGHGDCRLLPSDCPGCPTTSIQFQHFAGGADSQWSTLSEAQPKASTCPGAGQARPGQAGAKPSQAKPEQARRSRTFAVHVLHVARAISAATLILELLPRRGSRARIIRSDAVTPTRPARAFKTTPPSAFP